MNYRTALAQKFMHKLAQEENLFMVRDKRNGNKQGPYTERDAHTLARDLNDFVLRNAGIDTEPFEVVPESEIEADERLRQDRLIERLNEEGDVPELESESMIVANRFMRKLAEHDPEGEHYDPMEAPEQTAFDEPPEFDDDLEEKISALVEQFQDGLMTKNEFKAALDRVLGDSPMAPSMAWTTARFIQKVASNR